MNDKHVPVLTYPAERYKGIVEVSILGEDGMLVRSKQDHPLTVNGVQVYFRVSLQKYDGEWELVRYTVRGTGGQYPDWSALTVSRVDTCESASASANKKCLELAEDLAKYIAESRPEAIIQGEVHRLRRKHELIEDEKITLNARLSQVEQEIADVLFAIAGQEVRWGEVVDRKSKQIQRILKDTDN